MKMTTMKLMMMMTPSEEVDEVSFDPTASGRLFSAVQNIIGRSKQRFDFHFEGEDAKGSIFFMIISFYLKGRGGGARKWSVWSPRPGEGGIGRSSW